MVLGAGASRARSKPIWGYILQHEHRLTLAEKRRNGRRLKAEFGGYFVSRRIRCDSLEATEPSLEVDRSVRDGVCPTVLPDEIDQYLTGRGEVRYLREAVV